MARGTRWGKRKYQLHHLGLLLCSCNKECKEETARRSRARILTFFKVVVTSGNYQEFRQRLLRTVTEETEAVDTGEEVWNKPLEEDADKAYQNPFAVDARKILADAQSVIVPPNFSAVRHMNE